MKKRFQIPLRNKGSVIRKIKSLAPEEFMILLKRSLLQNEDQKVLNSILNNYQKF